MSKTLKLTAIYSVVIFTLIELIRLIASEPITFQYLSTWNYLFLSIVLGAVFTFFYLEMNSRVNVKQTVMVITTVLAIGITFNIFSSKVFLSEKLAKVLPVEDVNASQIKFDMQRAVTKDMAMKMANKIIGKKYNGVQVSSQYELNREKSTVQVVNGELLWVIPLDYRGFAKWLNQDHIPGYVTVSATNPRAQAELHLGYNIALSNNGYFMSNINRFAYIASNFKKVSTHFEINEEGKPYFISLVLEPTLNMTALKTTKVLVINAETKEVDIVNPEDVEKKYPWIDRIIDERVTDQQIHWYGTLQDGFLNEFYFGENLNVPTKYYGRELWIAHVNGRQVYFTGMTSTSTKDQSLVQGIVVDTKTGKAMAFDLSGVMDESGAVSVLDSALGANSTKWEPVLPQPFMLNGEFYWGSSIVSTSGIYQKAGIVNGANQSEVYFGKDFKEAEGKALLHTTSTVDSSSDKEEYIKVKKSVLMKILKHVEKIKELEKELY